MALASASDLTFNWVGFISAMVSNLTFGFRAVWSKKCAPHHSHGQPVLYAGLTLRAGVCHALLPWTLCAPPFLVCDLASHAGGIYAQNCCYSLGKTLQGR